MNESIVSQVKEVIAPLAEKIGQGAEFLYGVYYKQTLIEAVVQIAGCLFAITLVLIAGKVIRAKAKPENFHPNSYYNSDRKGTEAYAGKQQTYSNATKLTTTLSSIVIVGLISIGIFTGVVRLVNPHFYTIERIIESVRTKEVQ